MGATPPDSGTVPYGTGCTFVEVEADGTCGMEPVTHMVWDTSGASAVLCLVHHPQVLVDWCPLLIHRIAPACESPTGLIDYEHNRCVEPPGLPGPAAHRELAAV